MITIEEFLNIANVKLETVKKNADKIPGLKYENDKFYILSGTRYPGDFHRYKLKNSSDKRYVLLKAISEYKYIDSTKLKVYQKQFERFLRELLDAELISENNLENHYGANAYDCSPKGDEVLKLKKSKTIEKIENLVSSATGHFIGAVISKICDR